MIRPYKHALKPDIPKTRSHNANISVGVGERTPPREIEKIKQGLVQGRAAPCAASWRQPREKRNA